MVPERVHIVITYASGILLLLGIVLAGMMIRTMYSVHMFVRKSTRAVEYVGSSLLVPILSVLTSLRGSTTKKTKQAKTTQE